MKLHVISRFLLRAPLLPERALRDGRLRGRFAGHPLGEQAVALASPDLAAAIAAGRDGGHALERYARRAAFRPTPHGLLAGVAMGKLGRRTRIRTGDPRAVLTPSWARLARLGRELLDEPEVREGVAVRRAPSVLRSGADLVWLAPARSDGRGGTVPAEEAGTELDQRLAALLDGVTDWVPWAVAREVASRGEAPELEEAEVDEYLLLLLDDGVLAHDLCPPLIGPEPSAWMRERLAGLPPAAAVVEARRALGEACTALAAGDLRGTGAGADARNDVQAVLVLDAPVVPELSAAVVDGAASVAPVLFRLQECLAPPAAERALDPGLGECLDAVTEVLGAGALDVAALAAGDYGTPLSTPGEEAMGPAALVAPPPEVLSLLVSRLLAAGRDEAAFSTAELDAVLPEGSVPPTFELVLAPSSGSASASAGAGKSGGGWVLGVHAPAGATWGRFAHALGAPMLEALAELDARERQARPGERRLDVEYTPSPQLAGLCAHPPVREAALAVSGWPAAGGVAPEDLDLVADAAAVEPLALRRRGGGPVVPSPLARVRSTTAPAGLFRLLLGWSLFRQHAPWALVLGPLAGLDRVPRISIDGFVVCPASWRIPAELGKPRALGRWRRSHQVPRFVQVGHEDELLLVDLEAAGASQDLAAHERAWEVLPALGAGVDLDGRRVEAVVAVVSEPDDDAGRAARDASVAATTAAGRVPPPREQPPAAGWSTFKLFGAQERQDRVLLEHVVPVVRRARNARPPQVDRWHFLRFIDGPGRRDHLRVRVRQAGEGGLTGFAAALEESLMAARQSGDVVTVETAQYHPERARYGEDALPAVERIFESDSDLACGILRAAHEPGAEDGPETVELVVRSYEALAAGLGLALEERRAVALRRRAAHAGLVPPEALAAEYRARQRALAAAMDGHGGEADPLAALFTAHQQTVQSAVRALPAVRRVAILPALLHLAAVRLAGPDRLLEARAYVLWERALEGVGRRRGDRAREVGRY